MASILDSFIIQLGWDTREFDRGSKKIDQDTARMRNSARKDASEVEAYTKRASSSFRTVRNEVAGLVLAFAGANSIKGFISQMITGAGAAGRMADNLGISIEKLSGVRNAVRAVGGTDGEADTALSSLAQAFQSYQLTGSTGHDADFQGLGVSLNDLSNPLVVMERLAAASERMTRPEFVARLQRIGIPQSVINSLAKGREGYRQLTQEGERNANLHEKDAKAAQAFEKALNDITTTIQGKVQPWLTKLLGGLDAFLQNEELINLLMPITVGLLGSLAVATGLAAAPWLALAAAIGAVIVAYQTWGSLTDKEQKQFYADRSARLGRIWEKLGAGDISGALGEVAGGFSNSANLLTGGGVSGAPTRGGGNVSGLYNTLLSRYGKERADGIWAGIGAESSWNPSAVNPTSGAYGLGQWLGPRKRELFRRYGRNPTAAQQMEFLISELEGGDHGGAAVLAQNTRTGTLGAYVNSFMRPGPGAAGDMRRGMAILGGAPVGLGAQGGGSTTTTSTVSVGQIVVYSPDPERAGQNVRDTLRNRGLVTQANTGMAQ